MNEKILIDCKICNSKIFIYLAIASYVLWILLVVEDNYPWISFGEALIWPIPYAFPLVAFFLFLYFWLGHCEIVVTNARVYGKVAFGKQVDLPIDSISSVGRSPLLRAVSVGTSSGAIRFYLVQKHTEIYDVISTLIRNRQCNTQGVSKASTEQNRPANNISETLRAYKSLLDDGIITEAEYESKKKEILNS